jgi:signal transduction histidine kinase
METLDSVLHLSRLEAGMSRLDRTDVDVGAEIAETVDLLQPRADEKEIALHTDLPEEQVTAEVDPAALHRILDNIVGNALKFTGSGGRVDVSLRGEDDAVVIVVEDTGVGIDAEFLPELFDAFKQEQTGVSRTYEGSGLGLTVVRRLVDLHQGDIEVESTKNEGSRFTITLSRTPPSS